ncbi:calcium-binding protein [Streptococcus merionis]|uniref:calcium-binding protein n=1 Tax=Streptococcus merionis TaxID=400065 RepID=UPI0035116183
MTPKSIYERDSDNDGLMDAQELALGTNPFSPDSDGDGLTDLEEVQNGLLPTVKANEEKGYDLDL